MKKVRVNVDVPVDVRDQWDEWAQMIGLSRTSFLIAAASIGGRALERSIHPERFVSADLVKSLVASGLLDQSALSLEVGISEQAETK